jgi:hypothetical protein
MVNQIMVSFEIRIFCNGQPDHGVIWDKISLSQMTPWSDWPLQNILISNDTMIWLTVTKYSYLKWHRYLVDRYKIFLSQMTPWSGSPLQNILISNDTMIRLTVTKYSYLNWHHDLVDRYKIFLSQMTPWSGWPLQYILIDDDCITFIYIMK